jgi:shikimate dehydrogenase
METSDLIQRGVLQFAVWPEMNPRHLDFPRYTVPLIEHDYPAKTPAMWNAAYREFRMDAGNVILTGDPEQAPVIFETLRRDLRYLGGGAGVGFKEKAVDLVDRLDALATASGAVNFVTNVNGRLSGHNTDGIGYVAALEEFIGMNGEDLDGKTVLILGAGGTARSVANALARRGVRQQIVNRTPDRAVTLARHINEGLGQEIAAGFGEESIRHLVSGADIIVNVSTKGAAGPFAAWSALAPAALPGTADSLQRNLTESRELLERIPRTVIISDVVLANEGTPFLRQAREMGFRVLDGIPMVINQGVEAFWIVHGHELQRTGVSKHDVAAVMRRAAMQS